MDGKGKTAKAPLKELLTVPFLLITILSGLMTVCLQMTVSAMPLFVVELGVAKSWAGSATTACTLASLFFRPFSAKITDRMGGRKPAIFGAVLYVAVFLAYPFCANMISLLALRILQGIGMSLITTALGAVATQMIPKEQMTRGMSYFSLGNATALCIGPALGLELVEHFSYAGLFLFGAAASLLTVALLVILKTKQRDAADQEKVDASSKSFFQQAKACGAILPSGLMALMILCQTSLSTFLSFYAKSQEIGGASAFFTLNVFGMIVSKFILGNLCDRLGNQKVAMGCGGLLAAAYALVAASGAAGEIGLLAAGVLYGFGYGGFYTLLNVAAVKHSAPENRGVANSLFFGAKDIGTAVGSLVWGAIASVSYSVMYLMAMAVIGVLSWIYVRRLAKKVGR